MTAGKLHDRIRIERHSTVVDDAGQPIDGWELVAEVWSWIKGKSGSASVRDYSLPGNVPASITALSIAIRHGVLQQYAITPGMRVVVWEFGAWATATPCDIKVIQPDYESRELVYLVCERGGNLG